MSPLALSLRFLQAQPDGRLVELARQGHTPAFEALVRRYRRELLAYCRRVQPQSSSAEDVLQQTFLQAWRALSAGAEVREFRGWLYRIAHNVAATTLRTPVDVPHEVQDRAGGLAVDQVVEQRMRARAALASLAALPDLQREVMVSTTLDGASHEQVATLLGISSGSVRGLVYRARATLRAAAAALIPAPALGWALRRAGTRAGGGSAAIEAVAGGGGAGVAGVLVKGGAVIAAAGAVTGAGGLVLLGTSPHHQVRKPQTVAGSHGSHSALGPLSAPGIVRPARAGSVKPPQPGQNLSRGAVGAGRAGHAGISTDGRGSGSDGGDRSGDHRGSAGGSDGGSRGGGSDGAAGSDRPSASSPSGSDGGGSTGGDGGVTSGEGSDGGSGDSSTTSGSTATSDGGSGHDMTSGSGQVSLSGSGGGSGSDGG